MGVDIRQLSPAAQRQALQKLAESQKTRARAALAKEKEKDTPIANAAQSANKYGNQKVEIDGMIFDSKREARRYLELAALEKAGEIQDLQRQVEFELIPNQYETFERYGKKGRRLKDGQRLLEKKCVYVADFTYWSGGQRVVEDVKGYRNPNSAGYAKFAIKRKLMLYVHGIRIREV